MTSIDCLIIENQESLTAFGKEISAGLQGSFWYAFVRFCYASFFWLVFWFSLIPCRACRFR
jgi:hypothetical protein